MKLIRSILQKIDSKQSSFFSFFYLKNTTVLIDFSKVVGVHSSMYVSN